MSSSVKSQLATDIFILFIKTVRCIGHTSESLESSVDVHKITTEYTNTTIYDRMQI
jgi:hypothetical protein